ncbi:MAG: nuclear transport factor 2 family protein [Deltaproteobacteria bacterium]|jgi:hypothetical protein|nr:nuclear transport factor 2 family protein [Deltaproteobacteria bacterium]
MSELSDRTFEAGNGERLPLTDAAIRDVWTRTYNTDGKPDWSNIYPYYHPDIVFQDPIQRHEGIEAFREMCAKLAGRCTRLHFDIEDLLVGDRFFFIQWTMTMEFRRTPMTPMHGCSKFTLHEDGRILAQRDYYDLWGDIFAGVPGMKRLYPRFMRRLFG